MKKDVKGFTLLEMLVVVIIIGILAAITLPQYNKTIWKSRYVQAKTLARNIANSEEIYFTAQGDYTDNFNNLDIDIVPDHYNNNKSVAYFDWGSCQVVNTEYRKEVQCTISRNGMGITYFLEFFHGTYAAKNGGKVPRCIAYRGDRKPTPSDINYRVCLEETRYSNPITFGSTSLVFLYK